MYCAPKSGLKRKQTKKQVIAIAFLVCFIVASLLSGAFIFTHTGHTHDHNGTHGTCAACAQIQNAENILKLLSTAVVGVLASTAWLYTAAAIVGAIYSNIAVLTPITAKIRMNN